MNQNDQLSEKPGNVGEFDSCQRNDWEFGKRSHHAKCVLECGLKFYCQLHTCVQTGILTLHHI